MPNTNPTARTVIAELESLGATVLGFEHGGKHDRVYYRWRGREQFYVLSSSSSDWRAPRKAKSGLRRILGVRPVVRRQRGHGAGRSSARKCWSGPTSLFDRTPLPS